MQTFTAFDLVQLPRLDASGGQTLGAELLAVLGKTQHVPASVDEAVAELASAHRALNAAVAKRLAAAAEPDPARAKSADAALDACWSGLLDFLSGWSRVPDVAEAETATALIQQLFPTGVKFVPAGYEVEWAESNTRLEMVKQRKLDAPRVSGMSK